MKKMIHDSIAKLFVIVMIMLTMASNGIAMKVFAETATVYSEGSVIPTENIVELSLDTSTVTSDNIQRYNGEYSDFDVPSVPDMEEGKTYTAYYVKGLNYFGKQLTVKVDVSLADKAMTPSDGFNKVYIDSKGYIKVHWRYSYDVKVDWKITLLDPDTNAEYPIFVFMGIMDPDESNYYFDTNAYNLYYNEPGKEVASVYLVESDGLYKAYREGDTYTKIDTKGKQPITPYRDDGKFFVSKDAKWSSFEFRTNTFHNGALVVPYFYSYCYNVAFDANRPEGTTGEGTMDPQKGLEFETSYNLTKNAYTTEGYTFVGWNSKKDGTGTNFTDGQSFTDTVIKPDAPVAPGETVTIYAMWEPCYNVAFDANRPEGTTGEGTMDPQKGLEFETSYNLTKNAYTTEGYTFVGWNSKKDGTGTNFTDGQSFTDTVIKPDAPVAPGETVTIYAMWEPCYNVAFDANRPEGTTGEGTMDPQKGLEFETSYNLTKNAYTTEGYTFVGWNSKKDGTGTNFTDGQSFTDTVIKPDAPVAPGETVTVYAQWEMWKYWINYDPNGGKDPKDMPRQEFTYEDTKMESVLNKFTRDGYRFSGFLYTDKEGNSKLYKDIYDFVDILKGLGPNSEITLVAQWKSFLILQRHTPHQKLALNKEINNLNSVIIERGT